jgi:NADPH2:quinone reductase
MKAWLLDDFAGLAKLRRADVPEPTASAGQVLLAVEYAALNPADRYLAEGYYPAKPALPHILGRDAVGTVAAVGPGVTSMKVGDRRSLLRGEAGVTLPGTFAEKVAVPAEMLVPIPKGWTDQQAAGAALVYLTAYQAITQWHDLPAKAAVLVTGASGGVGVATVQLAHAAGHTVIALSRDSSKREQLKTLGADLAYDPSEPAWRKTLRQDLGTRRIDLAIDNIGGTLLPEVIETLGDHGRVSCVGRLAGPVPQFNTASLFFKRLRLGGVAVGAYTPAEARAAWEAILKLLDRTAAKPLVDSVFPFDQLPAAFAKLAKGPMGKVLLSIK